MTRDDARALLLARRERDGLKANAGFASCPAFGLTYKTWVTGPWSDEDMGIIKEVFDGAAAEVFRRREAAECRAAAGKLKVALKELSRAIDEEAKERAGNKA